jgi:antitoxin MazE
MQMTIKKWGNSLATRIPKTVAESIGLHFNQEVDIEAVDGRIVITPSKTIEYNLDDLLRQCKLKKMALTQEDKAELSSWSARTKLMPLRYKEWINSPPVGNEIW